MSLTAGQGDAEGEVKHRCIRELQGVEMIHARYRRHSFMPHLHEAFTIGVVEGGRATVWHRGATHELREGSIFAINPFDVHTGASTHDLRLVYRGFYVSRDAFATAVGDAAARFRFAGPVIDDRKLGVTLSTVHRQLAADSAGNGATHVFHKLLQRLASDHATLKPDTDPGVHPAVDAAREFIHRHYYSRLRITDLAEVVGISHFHLMHVFRERIGIPPHAYLDQIRVCRAQELLRQGYAPSHVAFVTGFSDQSHLTRNFKRTLGVTPGQYSRSHLRLTRQPTPFGRLRAVDTSVA